jgi:transcription initiation factor TFIIF subunit beta
MSSKTEEIKLDKELDCSNASRGVWLVKVPKYIAKKWEKGENFTIFMKFKQFWKLFKKNQVF